MDLDELLDGLDGEDIEDLFRRLRKRARASGEVMKKVATRLVMGVKGPTIGKVGTGVGVLGPYITVPKPMKPLPKVEKIPLIERRRKGY